MVDIHTHILPGADDGAHDMEESVEMARAAYESGTEYLVLTPHVGAPGLPHNYWSREMHRRYADFWRALHAAGIPLRIGYGAEIYYTSEMPDRLNAGQLLPLAGSQYLLIEFPFDVRPETVRDALSCVNDAGLTPVLAHPERYRMTARDPRAIYDWVKSGCVMQVNKDSLLGAFGHEICDTAHMLLSHGLIHCAASDAHHSDYRTPKLDTLHRYLTQIAGERCADLLLKINPGHLLRGEQPEQGEIIPF